MAVEITPDYMIIGGKKVDMRPPYTGVPEGPYKKHHDDWLKTKAGRAVQAERKKQVSGYLDFMLLATTGVTASQLERFGIK